MADQQHDRSATPAGTRSRARLVSPGWTYGAAALVAGVVGAWVSFSFLGLSLAALGIPDPGKLTTVGLPFVRSAGTLFACLGVGSFLMSAFGTPPRTDGALDLDGYRAARTGTWSMLVWALCALLLIPLYLSDLSGAPLTQTIRPALWSVALEQVSTATAMLWVAVFAGAAALFSLFTRRWIWQPVFLALAVVSLVPLALEGHSASGGNHDYGVNSFLWHIILAALWIGGLMALIAHALRRGPHLEVITRRYSILALFCIIGLAVSGVVNAAIRLRFDEWFTTDYGHVITAKAVLTVVLGLIGFAHRKVTIPALGGSRSGEGDDGSPRRWPFIRLAAVEVLIMAATIGVAVSLSRIPPPVGEVADVTPMELVLGFTLTEPPGWASFLGTWRFDLVFGTGALLLEAVYLWAWISLRRRGGEWPVIRVVCWTLGNVSLLVATSSGLGLYAMAMFEPHMLQHMILTMLIPVFWVLGGPVTLLLRALPAAGRTGVRGPREWIVVFINNPVSQFLTSPVVAAVQFVLSFYILYLTSLFGFLAENHAGHLFMNVHFLISGYVFYWVVIGVDAAPRQLSPLAKMLTIFAVMPFHAFFGITMMQMREPIARDYYESLHLPFPVDLLAQQHNGGAIAWGLGEIPLLIVVGAHFVQWLRQDRREAARFDRTEERRAEHHEDSELDAYNAMLAGLQQGEVPGDSGYYTDDYAEDEVHGFIRGGRGARGDGRAATRPRRRAAGGVASEGGVGNADGVGDDGGAGNADGVDGPEPDTRG
ncbi:cytochrome c oxidase assembly protein [Corynebacterium bovis]|uniref:Copper resistance protein CopD n=1 Tax=Corynebacterium bovis TaxID=36808 RepID=A0A426Q0U4_9CORY|nr:cytochrome c oxidase assembly protein [Corynebacterium bovis]MDN8579114.1 cytochrome c oxidase assembly protein [Corynebacterium bovis]RRO84543.1 copper resistance protein CopD [Corynebacterium bovis]RRO87583.1 copper resistance protein CopD [Corynebacterium bovis]